MERISANKNHNTPRQRWKRAGFFASRLNDGNKVMGDAGISQDETHADLKYLETQHWLELIDGYVTFREVFLETEFLQGNTAMAQIVSTKVLYTFNSDNSSS